MSINWLVIGQNFNMLISVVAGVIPSQDGPQLSLYFGVIASWTIFQTKIFSVQSWWNPDGGSRAIICWEYCWWLARNFWLRKGWSQKYLVRRNGLSWYHIYVMVRLAFNLTSQKKHHLSIKHKAWYKSEHKECLHRFFYSLTFRKDHKSVNWENRLDNTPSYVLVPKTNMDCVQQRTLFMCWHLYWKGQKISIKIKI